MVRSWTIVPALAALEPFGAPSAGFGYRSLIFSPKLGLDLALVVSALLFVFGELVLELLHNQVDQGKRIRPRFTSDERVLAVGTDDHLRRELFGFVIEHDFDVMDPIVEPGELARLVFRVSANVVRQVDMTPCDTNLH